MRSVENPVSSVQCLAGYSVHCPVAIVAMMRQQRANKGYKPPQSGKLGQKAKLSRTALCIQLIRGLFESSMLAILDL